MDITRAVKRMIFEKEVKQQDVGEKLGMSKSAFNQVINKNDFRVNSDLIRIADAIGYDVVIQLKDRETGKIIEVD